jgi:hypothetical protein
MKMVQEKNFSPVPCRQNNLIDPDSNLPFAGSLYEKEEGREERLVSTAIETPV